MKKDTPCQVQAFRQLPPSDQERGIARQAPLRPHLAPIDAPPSDVRLGLGLFKDLLDVGKACTAFPAGEQRRLLQVFLQARQIRPMGRRHIFQVEKLHDVGRRIHLAGEEMGIGRNLDAHFRDAFADFGIVRHHRQRARVGLPFIAAAGAAIQGRLVRIVFRCAAVRAK